MQQLHWLILGIKLNRPSVQFSSVTQSCLNLWDPMDCTRQASITNCLSPTPRVGSNSCPSPTLMLCCPLLLMPSNFSSIRTFSNESVLHIRWPKYRSLSVSISPNEYSGLISFHIDWLDLLAVQGILKSLLQHHSSETSILWHSAFFIVQLSHPYMTTGKTIALTRRIFVDKLMFLVFQMLSRLVITFLPRRRKVILIRALIPSWGLYPHDLTSWPPKDPISKYHHIEG